MRGRWPFVQTLAHTGVETECLGREWREEYSCSVREGREGGWGEGGERGRGEREGSEREGREREGREGG